MKKRTTKPELLLLDANVIFRTHELGVWENLIERVDVIIPASIAYDEVLFTKQGDTIQALDMSALARDGKVSIVEASVDDLASTISKFDRLMAEGLDKGEREALALIDNGKVEGTLFCTTDGPAIVALAILGYSELGISLERLLRDVGLQKSNLKWACTDKFFQKKIEEGRLNLVTGTGLASE